MASITSWTRLEPRPRSTAMRASLEAQVRDPLWLLGRQWQLGEFQGEDAGTPVHARLRAERTRLSRWAPGRPGRGLHRRGRSTAPSNRSSARSRPSPAWGRASCSAPSRGSHS